MISKVSEVGLFGRFLMERLKRLSLLPPTSPFHTQEEAILTKGVKEEVTEGVTKEGTHRNNLKSPHH